MATSNLAERVVKQRIEAVRRWLPEARRHDVRAVHQARVATRRLREALPVLAPARVQRRGDKVARKLTRALGPLRELDVTLRTLEELEAGGAAPRAATMRLRALLAREQRKARADVKRRLEHVDLGKLVRLTEDVGRTAIPDSRGGRSPRWRAVLVSRCGERASRLRLAIDRAAGLYLPDRLHDARIALKKLRYSMELAHDLSIGARSVRAGRSPSRAVRESAARLRTLRQAQELLGRMHDLDVLIARIRAFQGSPAVPTLQLSADLDRLVRQLENECRQLHARYVASRAGILSVCDVVEAAARRHRAARSAV